MWRQPPKGLEPRNLPRIPQNAQAKRKYEERLALFKAVEKEYEAAFAAFRPKFSDYAVVVSNYNGELWPAKTRSDFVKFVVGGGGFVSVHAADNAFPEWPEYNAMIGVGGWGGRNEKSGPYIRLRKGEFVLDRSKGNGGSHGRQHPFLVEIRNKNHPITAGLPAKWMHASDELYDRLRGPAECNRLGHRLRRSCNGRKRRKRTDANDNQVRQGPGVSHDARP